MKDIIKIAIADDHNLVREAIMFMLASEKGIKVLFDAGDGKDLLDKIPTYKPQIVLLDIEMPGISGKDTLRIIRQRYPKIKVIILSSHFHKQVIIDFIKMGACSFLPKDCNRSKLIEAINSVHADGHYFDKEVAAMLAKELVSTSSPTQLKPVENLSEVEVTIIRMLCQKRISKEIAEALNLSVRTIEWHRSNIMRTTHSKDMAELVNYAIQNHLVTFI